MVVELIIPIRSNYVAVTVLVCIILFFVASLVPTVIKYPEKLRKSVSAVDRLIVEVMLGQLPDKSTVLGNVSSISISDRLKCKEPDGL